MENSNKWVEDAFNSVKHQKQPTLQTDLFCKIEQKINKPNTKVLSLFNWKVAVAACLIFAINIFAFQIISANKTEINANENQLVNNYNIYAP